MLVMNALSVSMLGCIKWSESTPELLTASPISVASKFDKLLLKSHRSDRRDDFWTDERSDAVLPDIAGPMRSRQILVLMANWHALIAWAVSSRMNTILE
jgi:hypothetical protein